MTDTPFLAEKTLSLTRRKFLALLGLQIAAGGLFGCQNAEEPLLRFAGHEFPSYSLMFLAAERQYFSPKQVRLLDMPSATVSLQALAAGSIDGAALTLDEVISAYAEKMPLKIVAVLDVSLGADVILAKPSIRSLQDLKGKRIGIEQSAVGAVLLEAALSQANLTVRDVQQFYATVDKHRDLYLNGEVDALVTFSPVPGQLIGSDAHKIFDSRQIPGRIVDVLAVLPETAERNPAALRALIAGYFKALDEMRQSPDAALPLIARRMRVSPDEVETAFADLKMLNLNENFDWLSAWLSPNHNKLEHAAAELQQTMLKAGLLREPVDLSGLSDPRFLPNP